MCHTPPVPSTDMRSAHAFKCHASAPPAYPPQPYGVQLVFMNQVLRALDHQENALLEAPTGCGKTLSLLCAALAWQAAQKRKAADAERQLVARRLARAEAAKAREEGQLRGEGPDAGGCSNGSAGTEAADAEAAGGCGGGGCGSGCSSPSAGKPHSSKDAGVQDGRAAAKLAYEEEVEDPKAALKAGGAAAAAAADGAYADAVEADPDQVVVPKIYYATRTHSQIAQVRWCSSTRGGGEQGYTGIAMGCYMR